MVEQLVEESDDKSLNATGDVDPKTKKAKMLPISFCIKARKLQNLENINNKDNLIWIIGQIYQMKTL